MISRAWDIVEHVSQESVGGPLVTRIESPNRATATPFTFAKRKRRDVTAKNAVDLSGVGTSRVGGSTSASPTFFFVGPSLLLWLSHLGEWNY